MRLFAALLLLACRPAPPPDLQFVNDGLTYFSLREGSLRVADRVVAHLSPDGVLVFDEKAGRITATIDARGRVAIVAAEGTDLSRVQGHLGLELRKFGGRIESAYTIHPDGTATIPLGETLAFDAEGRISGLVVHGLTPRNRRTAMFIYVLLTMLIP
jgi:hypothetical protein